LSEEKKPVRPWDLFLKNKPKLDEEGRKRRLQICMECDKIIKATKQCKACGCFMTQKVKLEDAYCPLGKW
jgi:hypothetical protein